MEQPDREASLQHSADHLSSSDPDVVANALAKIRTELRTSSEEGALVIKVSGFSPPLLTLATCLTKKDRCSNGFGFLPIHLIDRRIFGILLVSLTSSTFGTRIT